MSQDEPEWVSLVLEATTKPNQSLRFFIPFDQQRRRPVSAHDVRGTAGSFSVTTPWKEVGKTSRMFTQVSVKQIGGCCAFRFRFRAVWDGSENLVTRAD